VSAAHPAPDFLYVSAGFLPDVGRKILLHKDFEFTRGFCPVIKPVENERVKKTDAVKIGIDEKYALERRGRAEQIALCDLSLGVAVVEIDIVGIKENVFVTDAARGIVEPQFARIEFSQFRTILFLEFALHQFGFMVAFLRAGVS